MNRAYLGQSHKVRDSPLKLIVIKNWDSPMKLSYEILGQSYEIDKLGQSHELEILASRDIGLRML